MTSNFLFKVQTEMTEVETSEEIKEPETDVKEPSTDAEVPSKSPAKPGEGHHKKMNIVTFEHISDSYQPGQHWHSQIRVIDVRSLDS